MAAPFVPSLTGFQAFILTTMGIPVAASPPDGPYVQAAYDTAIGDVNINIAKAPGPSYQQAVYNYAGDWLIQWSPDVAGVFYPTDNPDKLGWFAFIRKKWDVQGFVAGVIQSSADEGTSQGMLVPDQLKMLTLGDLQQLKTPYGRAYLQIAQKYGSLWGIT